MKNLTMKSIAAPLALAAALLLFGAPSSPVTTSLPTLGGMALANGFEPQDCGPYDLSKECTDAEGSPGQVGVPQDPIGNMAGMLGGGGGRGSTSRQASGHARAGTQVANDEKRKSQDDDEDEDEDDEEEDDND